MSYYPFMSKPDNANIDFDKMIPFINSCELYTGKQCSLKLLAKSQYDISKHFSEKNDN